MSSADGDDPPGPRDRGGLRSGGPAVVAVGGGHGLAASLKAIRQYAGSATAIVTVADDGGSSGRLRQSMGGPAVGDMRRCLWALAADEDSVMARTIEHRFSGGDLDGHALGNLLLLALADTAGGLVPALREAGRLVGAVGDVLPATTEPVVLKARLRDNGDRAPGLTEVEGQVAVATTAPVEEISLVPADPPAPPEAIDAILAADQVVLGPGSLFTSVLAAAVVPGVADAIRRTAARRIWVANLHEQRQETTGFTLADHGAALARHGIPVDVVLTHRGGSLELGPLHVDHVLADVAGPNGRVHDPVRLAAALSDLVG